jgi:Restriction endonuclease AspBHI N-terminal/Restriction endonuclease
MEFRISLLQVGKIYRSSDKVIDHMQEMVGGYPNYYAATHTPGTTKATIVKGINTLKPVKMPGKAERIPAIVIVSSSKKSGTATTPWENYIDEDNGYIRYYGDNASPDQSPEDSQGNHRLLEQFEMHKSDDQSIRTKAAPIIILERIKTGYVKFQGFGVITNAERVMQKTPSSATAFANYAFEIVVLKLDESNDRFCWNWISNRRNASMNDASGLESAPASWRKWVKLGSTSLTYLRRRISKTRVVLKTAQMPEASSAESRDLKSIYDFYTDRKNKHGFERLAEKISGRLFQGNGNGYTHGWITKASGDGGTDFVGRLDVGDGFSKLRIVVLGQAKCEKINKPTNGQHIARLVSRLRRGWVGVYVTTSFFSEGVQEEVIEDRCPIMMINGKRVAQEARKMSKETGMELLDYLQLIEAEHESKDASSSLSQMDPEQVLFIP